MWLPAQDPLRLLWRTEGPLPMRDLGRNFCTQNSALMAQTLSNSSQNAPESTSSTSHPVKVTGYFGLSCFDTLYTHTPVHTDLQRDETDASDQPEDVCINTYYIYSR